MIADALLDEPDMATLYYPRQDALLMGLYNKAKPAQGAGAEQQESALGAGLDGEREWRAAYRVMPDF